MKPRGPAQDLWQIAKGGDTDQLRQALARGADVNACNGFGMTPLMMAAYHGRAEMVRALVEHEAKIDAVDDDGLTAAMLAENAGHEEIVRTLVRVAVKRSRTSPAPEPSPPRFAQQQKFDASSLLPMDRHAEVRTLKEPPDIWDLVHETRSQFNAGSAFIGHLKALHPVVLAAILLIIGGGAAFWFIALRTSPESSSGAPAAQEQRNNGRVLNPQPGLSNRSELSLDPRHVTAANGSANSTNTPAASSSQSALSKSSAPILNQQSTIKPARTDTENPVDPSKTIAVPAASARTQVVAKPRRRSPMNPTTARGATVAGTDNNVKAQGSVLSAAESSDVARTGSKNNVQGSTDVKGSKRPAARPADKAVTPQLIAPARATATPKAKVIPWP